MASNSIVPRQHIQDHASAENLVPHWGYADRVMPCTNDAGSCEYLDVVYDAHDIGMIYMGILWATFLGILLVWTATRRVSGFSRIRGSVAAFSRRHLLKETPLRFIFGRTTLLQLLVLATLTAYLTIWSFVGIVYDIWVTPVVDMPGVYNTRTSLGPWSDRVGVLAYALTPLSVLLGSRESLLSLLTGVPYQNFNFLHRWVGYIVFVQSSLHTIGWCIVEIRLYQPQPDVATLWIKQLYMIWGVVAMAILFILFVLSTPWAIRRTGYEFFRKSHYVLAMVYIGACWGHWRQLECFLIPGFIFWGLDRGIRFIRSAMLHHHPHDSTSTLGFETALASVIRFPDAENGDILRLEIDNDQDAWAPGQHFYLCFPDSSIWQSHPFTPLDAPKVVNGKVRHTYVLRAKAGETKKLAAIAAAAAPDCEAGGVTSTARVILTGAYGEDLLDGLTPKTNILCVAGGTGITYVLPILLSLAASDRKVELIWAVRHTEDTRWVAAELDTLRTSGVDITIQIFATRDIASGSSGSSLQEKTATDDVCPCADSKGLPQPDKLVEKLGDEAAISDEQRHPNLAVLVEEFVAETASGPTTVFASGPGGMISDVRRAVAANNQPKMVWRGEERGEVRLVCDDRLEW